MNKVQLTMINDPVFDEYSNVFYQILDIRIRILKFSQTNIFGYLNTCCAIFEYLIIQKFIQMKPFPLFEALFEAALGRL